MCWTQLAKADLAEAKLVEAKSTNLYKSFGEPMEGWVVGWFEPGLPHTETSII